MLSSIWTNKLSPIAFTSISATNQTEFVGNGPTNPRCAGMGDIPEPALPNLA